MIRFIGFLCCLLLAAQSFAASELTAVPVSKAIKELSKEKFEFRAQGNLFGYYSTESCLYIGKTFALLKHYCYPKSNIPARSFTVISFKYGIIQFYEEKFPEFMKQDVRLNVFPEQLKQIYKGDVRALGINEINTIYRSVSETRTPACWSTNYSHYVEGPDTNCYETDIALFPEWSADAQKIVMNGRNWLKTMDAMVKKSP